MSQIRVFIANRGIWAHRISRTCRDAQFSPVGGVVKSDWERLGASQTVRDRHIRQIFDEYLVFPKADGPAALLDIEQVLLAADKLGSKFVHPGIGLLSESATFAREVTGAGFTWVGPDPKTLDIFGSKLLSAELATSLNVPTLSLGIVDPNKSLTANQSKSFPILLKASRGGGGLGHRVVHSASELASAYDRCLSESSKAFSSSDSASASASDIHVLCETFLPRARHIEVQIVGDGEHAIALGTRECSAQRRFQKVIEVAPAPNLSALLEEEIVRSAVRIAEAGSYKGVGTMEFLVPINQQSAHLEYYFVECNPRLQVEHTVTEEVMNVDIVSLQLQIAQGKRLSELGLPIASHSDGQMWWRSRSGKDTFAIQCRINCEQVTRSGVFPADSGALVQYLQVPTGAGVRVESAIGGSGNQSYAPNPQFDSLLALLVVKSQSKQLSNSSDNAFASAVQNTVRALDRFAVVGTAPTNAQLVRSLLCEQAFVTGQLHTRFIDENLSKTLLADSEGAVTASNSGSFGTMGHEGLVSPMKAVVVDVVVKVGDFVTQNDPIAILGALKMEHELKAPFSGVVTSINVEANNEVDVGELLIAIDKKDGAALLNAELMQNAAGSSPFLLTASQQSKLDEFHSKSEFITNDQLRGKKAIRPNGRLTARKMISQLLDSNSQFIEYGKFGHQEGKPDAVADSIICGIGMVNQAKVALCVYDYTVLAGTQGFIGHSKMDRLFEICEKEKLPLILLPEGGGGRAGNYVTSGLHAPGFTLFANLKGKVPLIGGISGFCFAGNAALLGVCDVIVGSMGDNTTSIGMGGPAMIEGGGLGKVSPNAVGPVQMHYANGIVDYLATTDEEMVSKVKELMTIFSQKKLNGEFASVSEPIGAQDILRAVIPDNRKRSFNIRTIIDNVFDKGSAVELRAVYGGSVITGFARVDGISVGYLANDCKVLSGAIDAKAAEKMTAFLNMCNDHKIPVVSFCDTPGFLVGVEAEKEGLVRRAGELFVAGAKLTSPLIAIVVRRAYGLGAMAMCGGSLKRPLLTAAWHQSEFGAMGIEGAIQLGFRDQIKDNPAKFQQLVDIAYDRGKAYTIAGMNEFDSVIEPGQTRHAISQALQIFRI